jgi:glucose-6-phosphate 1-dehydrogenase
MSKIQAACNTFSSVKTDLTKENVMRVAWKFYTGKSVHIEVSDVCIIFDGTKHVSFLLLK